MALSTHYYVLSLSEASSRLYEGFRDSLIGVENQGFPVTPSPSASETDEEDARNALMLAVDACFDSYDLGQRLGLIVVGDEKLQSAFDTVTSHASAIVARVKMETAEIHADLLGQIVWPVVKELISDVLGRALHDLDACSRQGRVVAGLNAVIMAAGRGDRATLLVEDDYHVRGSLTTAAWGVVSKDVDIRDLNDDAVDAVIERVLECGGNVVFLHSGDLADRGRIALLLREA